MGGDPLAVVAAACDSAPPALVLDDAQWADDHSGKALAFMLRHVFAEPVLVMAAARTDDPGTVPPDDRAQHPEASPGRDRQSLTRGTAHLPPFHLTGLGLIEMDEAATAAGTTGLGRAALQRRHEHTAGHPLHLRFLLAQVTPQALADLARRLPVPATLEAITRHILNRLPDAARRLVEAVAVLDAATPLATVSQLAGLADSALALTPP